MKTLNSYLTDLNLLIEIIIFLMVIHSAIVIIKKIYALGLKQVEQKGYISNLLQGTLSLKDIEILTPKEFTEFCREILEKDGFYDIEEITPFQKTCTVACKKGTDSYYVECVGYHSLIKTGSTINVEYLRRHIGLLEGNNYTHSLIITTGRVSKEAEKYIKTLPERYSIEVIDGNLLIRKYEFLRTLSSIALNE